MAYNGHFEFFKRKYSKLSAPRINTIQPCCIEVADMSVVDIAKCQRHEELCIATRGNGFFVKRGARHIRYKYRANIKAK